jgi:PA domain/Subtilase family
VLNYPAAYPTVIAVSAVTSELTLASYSQRNDQVDIAAPGDDILSATIAGQGKLAKLSLPDKDFTGIFMRYANRPTGNVTGKIFFCSNYGTNACEGDGEHICAIERGEINFDVKARNCEAGGGIAAVIYNTETEVLDGALVETTETTIPVFGMSNADGVELVASYSGEVASLSVERNYAYMSGTRYVSPHLAPVSFHRVIHLIAYFAGLAWRRRMLRVLWSSCGDSAETAQTMTSKIVCSTRRRIWAQRGKTQSTGTDYFKLETHTYVSCPRLAAVDDSAEVRTPFRCENLTS